MRRAPCGYIATRALPVAVPEILFSHTLTEFRPLPLLIAPLTPPPAAVANVPVPMYADGRELLDFRTFSQSASVSKRVFRHAVKRHGNYRAFSVAFFRKIEYTIGRYLNGKG